MRAREKKKQEGVVVGFYFAFSLSRLAIMSLHVATEGEAKGVAGKKGVPVADSDLGVCPAMPVEPASSLDDSRPSASVAGKMALKPRWIRYIQSTVQNNGIERIRRKGIAHGMASSRANAMKEASME